MSAELLSRVRALIQDKDAQQLTDEDLTVFVALEGGDTAFGIEKLTAAQALETIARNQALLLKRIKTLALETDGPALSKELRAHGDALRQQVRDALQAARVLAVQAAADAEEFSFDFVQLSSFP